MANWLCETSRRNDPSGKNDGNLIGLGFLSFFLISSSMNSVERRELFPLSS